MIPRNTTIENLVATDTQLLLPELQSEHSEIFLGTGDSGSGLLVYRREENNAIFLYGANLRFQVPAFGSPKTRGWEEPTPGLSAWPQAPFRNDQALCSQAWASRDCSSREVAPLKREAMLLITPCRPKLPFREERATTMQSRLARRSVDPACRAGPDFAWKC